MGTSRFQGCWVIRRGGPLTIDEARNLVRSRGVKIPKYLSWYVAEHEGMALEDCGLANADFPNGWDGLTVQGRVPVWIREEALQSEDHSLYFYCIA